MRLVALLVPLNLMILLVPMYIVQNPPPPLLSISAQDSHPGCNTVSWFANSNFVSYGVEWNDRAYYGPDFLPSSEFTIPAPIHQSLSFAYQEGDLETDESVLLMITAYDEPTGEPQGYLEFPITLFKE